MTIAIETFSITKQFPKITGWRRIVSRYQIFQPAVDGVNLSVREGELFGLLGPNGAGKTTLIKMLSTLIQPTSGTARVNGYDLSEDIPIKASIGLVTSDERSFYWRLTGRQNLVFFANLHGLPPEEIRDRVNIVLDHVKLSRMADQRFLTYSTGTRQRLSIARALLNQPTMLFLDEPTKGLDPLATRGLHNLIQDELRGQLGMTVFLTTHDLEEAQTLCDRIAIMHLGRIRACGTLSELRETLQWTDSYRIWVKDYSQEKHALITRNLPHIPVEICQHVANPNELTVGESHLTCLEFSDLSRGGSLNSVLEQLRQTDSVILQVTQQTPTLEQIFAHHTEVIDREPAPPSVDEIKLATPILKDRQPENAGSVRSDRIHQYRPAPLSRIASAFLRRDFLEESSYRFAFVLQILNILFSVSLFYFISLLVGDAAEPYLSEYGGDYFSFVLIGIAFSGYFGVGLSSFSNRLRQAQITGTLEAMLSTPTRLSHIIISSSLWEYFITTLRVLVYLGVGVILLGVNLSHGNYLGATLILLLTIITFSSLGIISASFVMVLKRGDPVAWAFNAVSTLLGGVYYPITILPGWLQIIARLIPVTYALEGMRLALLQGATIEELAPYIAALLVFSVILLPSSLLVFRYAVARAKVEGSLTHY